MCTLTIQTAGFSEVSEHIYQNTRRYRSEDSYVTRFYHCVCHFVPCSIISALEDTGVEYRKC
jgi:hypothetical protein